MKRSDLRGLRQQASAAGEGDIARLFGMLEKLTSASGSIPSKRGPGKAAKAAQRKADLALLFDAKKMAAATAAHEARFGATSAKVVAKMIADGKMRPAPKAVEVEPPPAPVQQGHKRGYYMGRFIDDGAAVNEVIWCDFAGQADNVDISAEREAMAKRRASEWGATVVGRRLTKKPRDRKNPLLGRQDTRARTWRRVAAMNRELGIGPVPPSDAEGFARWLQRKADQSLASDLAAMKKLADLIG